MIGNTNRIKRILTEDFVSALIVGPDTLTGDYYEEQRQLREKTLELAKEEYHKSESYEYIELEQKRKEKQRKRQERRNNFKNPKKGRK